MAGRKRGSVSQHGYLGGWIGVKLENGDGVFASHEVRFAALCAVATHPPVSFVREEAAMP